LLRNKKPTNKTTMKIHLTAMIKSTEGNAATVKELIKDLVAASVKEAGCLQYELYQSFDDENQFILHETWENEEILENHNHQPHLQTFVEQSQFFLDGKIVTYKTAKL
jgi:quinol monooxygenase YgiN